MEGKEVTIRNEKDQRDFSMAVIERVAAVGLAGLGTLGLAKEAKAAVPQPGQTWKQWAKMYLKGVENETLPSFTPDSLSLSEAGIRLDVRQAIRHGFISTMCASEAGLSLQEAKDLLSIVVDEAGDELLVSTSIMFDTFDDCFEMLEFAAQAGCAHVLLGYPPSYYPSSINEIVQRTKEMIQAADIGVFLYASPIFNFKRFSTSYDFPLDVIRGVVDLPNVIGIKVGGSLFRTCYRNFKSKAIVANPDATSFVTNARWYGQQWIGAGPYEYAQSPEKPYFVQMVTYCLEGKYQQATTIQKQLKSAIQSFTNRQNYQAQGVYNWPEHKYYQWCAGGNGGYTRQPVMKISASTMGKIKEQYAGLSITPSTPDEMFYEGRVY